MEKIISKLIQNESVAAPKQLNIYTLIGTKLLDKPLKQSVKN